MADGTILASVWNMCSTELLGLRHGQSLAGGGLATGVAMGLLAWILRPGTFAVTRTTA